MKNVLVVYNIHAGRKKSIKYKKKLQKYLLNSAEKFKFVAIDELQDVDVTSYDTIVAMGGDGTVNKVLSCVVNTDKSLGIIPCGTANLLAEKLGISTNFNKALNIFKTGKIKTIDVFMVNDICGGLRLGIGYDADIICKTPQSLKHKFGYFAYFVAGILFALRLKNREYVLNYKNEELQVSASCIIVANAANMYRNWISVAKNCDVQDGLLDIFVLKTTNPVCLFFELIKMFFGWHKTSKNAAYFKTASISIENNWTLSHIDGEKYKFSECIDISTINSALNVICGK